MTPLRSLFWKLLNELSGAGSRSRWPSVAFRGVVSETSFVLPKSKPFAADLVAANYFRHEIIIEMWKILPIFGVKIIKPPLFSDIQNRRFW